MLRLPTEFYQQICVFSTIFTRPTWTKAIDLLVGAILCPGSRTVCNVLRVLGLRDADNFDKYHAVLNRARWSALQGSRLLLGQLVSAFVGADQPLVFGIDETIERRWGSRISKRGIYRDPVRSSRSHFVKCSGLRWMSLMLLAPLPWLERGRYWALPFLTALCPSERYFQQRPQPRRAKKLTDWSRQLIRWLGRYVTPLGRPVYLVGDNSYATYELMGAAQAQGIGLISRLKMNARLFHLPKPKPKGRPGRQSGIGKRLLLMSKRLTDRRIKWQTACFEEWYGNQAKKMQFCSGVAIWDSNKGVRVKVRWVLLKDPEGKLDPVLLACCDPDLTARQVIRFFVRRWRVEVTFAELRRHLGVETQRQWSELAIERTTPVLFALKSIVCLLAQPLYRRPGGIPVQQAAWYPKQHLSFSDVLTAVRQALWRQVQFPTSPNLGQVGHWIRKLERIYDALVLAAA